MEPSSLKKKFFEEGDPPPPVTYFHFTLDPPLGGYGPNIWMHVWGHEHFIPTKFHKHPLSGSVVKADCVPIHIHALVQPPSPFRHLKNT